MEIVIELAHVEFDGGTPVAFVVTEDVGIISMAERKLPTWWLKSMFDMVVVGPFYPTVDLLIDYQHANKHQDNLNTIEKRVEKSVQIYVTSR